MSAREKILGRIRSQKKRGPLDQGTQDLLAARIAKHARNVIPKRAQIPVKDQLDLFQIKMEKLMSTVDRVKDASDVPAAVQVYLAQHNLPSRIKMSPAKSLMDLAWADIPTLEIVTGAGAEEDMVGLSPAFAAVAETGTLMMLSGPETPSTVNFLPENHIVILQAGDVTGSYEEAWDSVREATQETGMPRTVNFISGPSRTADIETRLIMGAHGPKSLHVILVGDGT
ncbi:MAG: lactate utilization protein [Sneathiella sp.]|nr:lactate utilization protein [Sneathiella sp.]